MGFEFKKKTTEKKISEKQQMLSEDSPFYLTEAYRNLKVNISLSVPKKEDGKAISIFFTSCFPNEGKSTTSVNTSLMYASPQNRVLLIDADMRKGTLHKYFSLRHRPGLSEYLSGSASSEEIIRPVTERPNLSVICCGSAAPNPYELLRSSAMAALCEQVSGQYDYIIIDTPPLGMMSDCLALVPYVDGCAIVSRYLQSTYKDLRSIVSRLQFSQCKVLGVVMNDCELKSGGKRGYGKYGYGYGYGYGGEIAE